MSVKISTPLADVWIDQEIGFVKIHRDIKSKISLRGILEHYQVLNEMTDGKSTHFICIVDKVEPFMMERIHRKMILRKYHLQARSVAFVVPDVRNTYLINLFCKLTPTKVPMKVFKSTKEARCWLMRHRAHESFSHGFSF